MKVHRSGQAAILTISERNRIRRCLKYPYLMIFDIAWYTGERWGAIIKLRQDSVYEYANRPRELITFTKQTRKRSGGKTAHTRQVPVHNRLLELLRAYPLPDSALMFPSPKNTERPLTFQACDHALRLALDKAGLKNKGISTHSTRRTFITTLYQIGVPLKELMTITGHSSTSSLLRYVEVSEERIKKQLMMID